MLWLVVYRIYSVTIAEYWTSYNFGVVLWAVIFSAHCRQSRLSKCKVVDTVKKWARTAFWSITMLVSDKLKHKIACAACQLNDGFKNSTSSNAAESKEQSRLRLLLSALQGVGQPCLLIVIYNTFIFTDYMIYVSRCIYRELDLHRCLVPEMGQR